LNYSKWKNEDLQTFIRGVQHRWLYVDRGKVHKELFGPSDQLVMYVPIDGAPTERQLEVIRENLPRRCAGLTLEEIVGLGKLVDPNLAASAINLPLDWEPPALESGVESWTYYNGVAKQFKGVRVCPSTMRPFFRVNDGRSWKESWESIIGHQTEVFSGHCWYGRFVKTTQHYPNAEELVEFIFNHTVLKGPHTTLMQDIMVFAAMLVEHYCEVIVGVRPEMFIWRFKKSADIVQRLKMESEAPQDKTLMKGMNSQAPKPPKGKKKLFRKKHISANQQRHLHMNE
jgi:hypothetical protein